MSDDSKRLEALSGKTLKTLARAKAFEVDVQKKLVFVRPAEGTDQRRIDKDRILTVAAKRYPRDEIRQRVIELFGPTRNASYIAAIAHEIAKPAAK